MATFEEWCEHYDYSTESEEARQDYARYCQELSFLQSLFKDDAQGEEKCDTPTSRQPR